MFEYQSLSVAGSVEQPRALHISFYGGFRGAAVSTPKTPEPSGRAPGRWAACVRREMGVH